MISERPYQSEARAAIREGEARGLRRMIIVLATGLGKTVVAAYELAARPGRKLFLAHRDELMRQTFDKIRMVDPAADVGFVKAKEDDVHSRIVVASVQTLCRPQRLERFRQSLSVNLWSAPEPLTTVFVDECHHAASDSYVQVLRGLGCLDPDGPLTIGLTATPERSDSKALGGVFQEVVYQLGILDGIRQGYLVDLKARQIKLKADFSKLHVRAGEFRDEESAELLMEADAPKHAAQAYLAHAKGQRAVIFTPTVAVSKAMAHAFREAGVPAEHVDGETPIEERRAINRRLERGETLAVSNCAVWTEGWDCPPCSVAIIARPTRSRPSAIQMIGRVLRPYPGKDYALVLDLVGSATRMDLVTVASLFDVTPEAAEHGVFGATGASAAAKALKASTDEAQDGKLIAVDVELFKGREFTWLPARRGRFKLRLGKEGDVELVQTGPDAWDVLKVKRIKTGTNRGGYPVFEEKVEKLYANLNLGYAQGAGEDYVRKNGADLLNKKDAPWRKDPASKGQIEILEERGKWRPGMTKGEASDAISGVGARF